MRIPSNLTIAVLSVGAFAGPVVAQHDVDPDHRRFFREQAWPIIERSCLPCHGGEDRIRGDFRIDARSGLLKGGVHGAAIDPEHPGESLILRMISWEDDAHQMPPSGKLPPEDLAVLNEWILHGAPWSEGIGSSTDTPTEDRGDWWAWRDLDRPEVPDMDDPWIANPIDAFVLRGLREVDLAPAPTADRRTLIRRVAFDLTGLPPTLEEIDAYLGDEDPQAYRRMIDRYLASPQHGVKWARHWLDAVRYADTDGYERDRVKPEAWRYRDWVVDAINQDKPWNRFLSEQLAGDELPDRDRSSLIATGFYRLGVWDDEPTDVAAAQADDLDSIIDVVGRGMMGMSIACARCHEHKRDPISQADYYRLAAVFRDLRPYKTTPGNSIATKNVTRFVPEDFGSGDVAYEARRLEHRRLVARLVGQLQAAGVSVDPADDPREHGLIAHYEMSDTDQGRLVDRSGRHPGRVVDARFGRKGRFGGAIGFDGGDDHAWIPHVATESFTISFWFRTESEGAGSANDPRWFTGSGLIDGEISGIVDDLGIAIVGPGIVAAGVGNPETFVSSSTGHHDGDWHHVAFTRDASNGDIALFLDGCEVDRDTGGTQSLDDIGELAVARLHPGGQAFHGDLDEIRVHDRALPSREIRGLFADTRLDDRWVASIEETHGPERAERFRSIRRKLERATPPDPGLGVVLCATSHGPELPETSIFIRGDVHSPGRQVSPGAPTILGGLDFEPSVPSHGESSGVRIAFADWLVSPDNPVTWRVAANRVWQHLFGRGIVESSDDFGSLGTTPTNPELLDWLATEFTEIGGSRREMIRLILESNTYRMSGRGDEHAREVDPLNERLWRRDLRRLSAEEIRDSILAMSGHLNPGIGGPGVYPPLPEAVLDTASRPEQAWSVSNDTDAGRRSLFVFLKRSLRHPLLEGFDQPDTDRSCAVRFQTTVPSQSLMLMNSAFTDDQATRMLRRLREERPDAPREQIRLGLERATGRPVDEGEIDELMSLVHAFEVEDGLSPDQAMTAVCVLILNLNEFLHVD